ncbi:187-kDa microtubule-associated protein air9 [Orobanche hederae]
MGNIPLEVNGSRSSVRKSVAKVFLTQLDHPRSLVGPDLESWDSRMIMLPQVEVKAGYDVRLDLRGHKIWSLNIGGPNLPPNLEFVYIRGNLLSTLDGVEVLKRVKVLDLSFNDFKGPGFEPLENCKALQITSLKSLPELPNLDFSVAQNKSKSLSMASQPRLQVLAASKNKISTLKGFPYLPSPRLHLRVEENPILKMSRRSSCNLACWPNLEEI